MKITTCPKKDDLYALDQLNMGETFVHASAPDKPLMKIWATTGWKYVSLETGETWSGRQGTVRSRDRRWTRVECTLTVEIEE